MAAKRKKSAGKKLKLNARHLGWGLLVALLALVAGAPLVIAGLGRAPDSDYSAGGYTRLVNDLMVARNWLIVDYGSEPRPRIALADDSLTAQRPLQRFIRSSYLRRDMEVADPAVWIFDSDGKRVKAISPDAHRIAGPFGGVSAWTGDILFREQQSRTPIFRDGGSGRYTLSLTGSNGLNSAGMVNVPAFTTRGSAVTAPRFRLVDRGATLATVSLLGDQVFVRTTYHEDTTVKLGPNVMAASDSQPVMRRWRERETLVLSRNGNEARFTLGSSSPAISTAQGGRLRTPYRGLESFSLGVERSMPGSDRDRPVLTTLDASLQAAAQKALFSQSQNLRGNGQAFPAALTMMDGTTGEILALASYPSAPEHLDESNRRSVQPPPILNINQNFVRLPIGSVAKAPISLAILQADPQLATLRVKPATDVDSTGALYFDKVLGVDLGGDFDDHTSGGADGYIDFKRFLEKSSNKYAAALMIMGLRTEHTALGQGVIEPYTLNNVTYTAPPRLPTLYRGGLQDTAYMLWKIKLENMFDVAADGQSDSATLPYDRKLWGPLARSNREAFSTVSPAKENLGLNDVQDIGTDYVMTILGGNRSRWTTIKVAEIFSRMVTRRRISATIVKVPAPAGGPSGDAFISNAAWAPVMDGLRAVAETGTAARLAAAKPQAPDGDVRIFAKTGTPALERYVGRTPRNQALQLYAEANCGLVFVPGRELHLRHAPVAKTVTQLSRALATAAPGCVRNGPARMAIAQEIVRLNRTAAADGQIAGLGMRGQDVATVPREELKITGAGHVLALVVGVYASKDDANDKPVRALTIVINIQNRKPGNTTPALSTAVDLLNDPAVRNWLRDPARSPRSPTSVAKVPGQADTNG